MINIKSDSRKINKGDTFIALKGIENDGHDYIESAIKNGATKVIAEHGTYSIDTLIVKDTTAYLEKYLEDNYRKYLNEMTLIVITGTNGKTTGAFLIYETLNKLGIKCGYAGTIGYYLDKKICPLPNTTPDLCSMYDYIINAYEKGYRYFVLEASSQGIAMGRLKGLKYDYAIYTNLTHEHLDFHKTMENYMETKKQIFYDLKKDGIAIINSDDSYYKNFMLKQNTNITYGFNDAMYKVQKYDYSIDGTVFKYSCNKQEYTISSPLLGEYNIYNIMPLLVILNNIGISYDKYYGVIKNLETPHGRNEMIKYNSNLIVIDYAHTPDGIGKIGTTFKQITKSKLYIVFGERGNRDRTKRPEMLDVATSIADYVIVTNNHLFNEDQDQIIEDIIRNSKRNNYEVCKDRRKAIEKGIELLHDNDILLILGKGHEDYLDIGGKRIPFDDYEIAKEIVNNITVK